MRLVVAAALLLAGCDDFPQARTESEIRLIAEDVADGAADRRVAALSDRIEELERQVDYLEAENRFQKAELDLLAANDRHDTKSIKSLFYNDCLFSSRLGLPWDGRYIAATSCEK